MLGFGKPSRLDGISSWLSLDVIGTVFRVEMMLPTK